MTQDDMIAYLASCPIKERPSELRSNSRFLRAWRNLRKDTDFVRSVLIRYGLLDVFEIDEDNPSHCSAVLVAWEKMRVASYTKPRRSSFQQTSKNL